MIESHSGPKRPTEPFIVRIGDVFGDPRGIDSSLRVIRNLGFGSVAVGAAVPEVKDGIEYFSVIGSTHLLTEIQPFLDRWSIDRIIAAYREGIKIQYHPLPEASREELILDFIDDLRSSPQERLVTVADIEAAEAYEQAQRKRWAALDKELGI